jgi:hypothetical protein
VKRVASVAAAAVLAVSWVAWRNYRLRQAEAVPFAPIQVPAGPAGMARTSVSGGEPMTSLPAPNADDPCSSLYTHYESEERFPGVLTILELNENRCNVGRKPVPMEAYSRQLAARYGRKSCWCLLPRDLAVSPEAKGRL